jgi:hypothetical protein
VGLPCTVMSCGDVIYRSTLPQNDGFTITVLGVALALAAVSYLWSPRRHAEVLRHVRPRPRGAALLTNLLQGARMRMLRLF